MRESLGDVRPSDRNTTVFRSTVPEEVDPSAPTGVSLVKAFFVGPTAQEPMRSPPAAHRTPGPLSRVRPG